MLVSPEHGQGAQFLFFLVFSPLPCPPLLLPEEGCQGVKVRNLLPLGRRRRRRGRRRRTWHQRPQQGKQPPPRVFRGGGSLALASVRQVKGVLLVIKLFQAGGWKKTGMIHDAAHRQLHYKACVSLTPVPGPEPGPGEPGPAPALSVLQRGGGAAGRADAGGAGQAPGHGAGLVGAASGAPAQQQGGGIHVSDAQPQDEGVLVQVNLVEVLKRAGGAFGPFSDLPFFGRKSCFFSAACFFS